MQTYKQSNFDNLQLVQLNLFPNNLIFIYRFLNNRNKRPGLSANAVATEQKATKVKSSIFVFVPVNTN